MMVIKIKYLNIKLFDYYCSPPQTLLCIYVLSNTNIIIFTNKYLLLRHRSPSSYFMCAFLMEYTKNKIKYKWSKIKKKEKEKYAQLFIPIKFQLTKMNRETIKYGG